MKLYFCQPDYSLNREPYLAYVSKRQGPYSRFMHMHPDTVEVILITDGTGEYFIGNRSYPVSAGHLVIYNSQVVHDEYLEAGSVGGSTICCGIRNLVRPGLRPNSLIADGIDPVFPLHQHYDNVFLLMNAIFMMLNSTAEHRRTMAQELMRVLLCYIDSNVLLTQEGNRLGISRHLQQDFTLLVSVKTFIDDNFHEPIRLDALAKKFRVSPFYISHEFKKRYGYSPMDYLIKRRLGEAQTLLITADEGGNLDKNVTEIAYHVGFNNLSHFQSYFKNKVGKTPGQYRNEYLQANRHNLKG